MVPQPMLPVRSSRGCFLIYRNYLPPPIASNLCSVKFISEPDKGVYDAMNKGVSLCTGDYVLFMNAGDSFYDEQVLHHFDKLILKNPCHALYGNTLMRFYEGDAIKCDNEEKNSNPVMPFIHQSVIVRRKLLLEHPFDTSYKILADYEFFYWMRQRGFSFCHDSFVASKYDAREGLSENNPLQICYERDRILGLDKQKNYAWRRLIKRCTIGLIQPIKDVCPRFLLNIYFRKKRKNVIWVD